MGLGLTHVRPVWNHIISLDQPFMGITVRYTPMSNRSLIILASSPQVRAYLWGKSYIPIKERQWSSIWVPSGQRPLMGLGRSKTTKGIPSLPQASMQLAME